VKAGKLENEGPQQKPLAEIEAELARVNRELAEVKMEPTGFPEKCVIDVLHHDGIALGALVGSVSMLTGIGEPWTT
jgi:hypothetical protein